MWHKVGNNLKDQKQQTRTDPGNGSKWRRIPSKSFKTVLILLNCSPLTILHLIYSASVDLQLPQVEESTSTTPTELPPEPKQKFKERVITSLGDQSGPASFRKSKTQNGKSRSLRQREDDWDTPQRSRHFHFYDGAPSPSLWPREE